LDEEHSENSRIPKFFEKSLQLSWSGVPKISLSVLLFLLLCFSSLAAATSETKHERKRIAAICIYLFIGFGASLERRGLLLRVRMSSAEI
jgi:amino acid transporter